MPAYFDGLEFEMNIQSGYSNLYYQGAERVTASRFGAATAKSSPTDAVSSSGISPSSTQVSISDAARRLASQGATLTQERTAIQERLLNTAASDPQSAEKLTYDIAYAPSTIFYDLRGVSGGEAVSKLSSGRVIDDAFKAKFSSEASVVDAQRKSLYDSEKAKGTPADQILAKLFDFTNSQSRDYLEASGWLASVGGKAA